MTQISSNQRRRRDQDKDQDQEVDLVRQLKKQRITVMELLNIKLRPAVLVEQHATRIIVKSSMDRKNVISMQEK
jgi:hypothetical protein